MGKLVQFFIRGCKGTAVVHVKRIVLPAHEVSFFFCLDLTILLSIYEPALWE